MRHDAKFFEASVCDLTKGWHLDVVGEVKKMGGGCGGKFWVWLLYDSDLSRIVEIF